MEEEEEEEENSRVTFQTLTVCRSSSLFQLEIPEVSFSLSILYPSGTPSFPFLVPPFLPMPLRLLSSQSIRPILSSLFSPFLSLSPPSPFSLPLSLSLYYKRCQRPVCPFIILCTSDSSSFRTLHGPSFHLSLSLWLRRAAQVFSLNLIPL